MGKNNNGRQDVDQRGKRWQAIAEAYGDYLFCVQTDIACQTNQAKPATLKMVNALKDKFLEGSEVAGEARQFDL